MADLEKIGQAVVAANREGRVEELLERYYAPDAVSVEAQQTEGMDREAHGLDAIRGKHAWWNANMVEHSTDAKGPFPHPPDRFAVIYEVDATDTTSGQRMQMHEVALYTVKDDKIVREEFFYGG